MTTIVLPPLVLHFDVEIRSQTSAAEDKWAFARARATWNFSHIALRKLRVTLKSAMLVLDMSKLPKMLCSLFQIPISYGFGVIEGNRPAGNLNVTAKTPNLTSFWPLTSERKVRFACFWSHFVGPIELQPLNPFGKPSHVYRI